MRGEWRGGFGDPTSEYRSGLKTSRRNQASELPKAHARPAKKITLADRVAAVERFLENGGARRCDIERFDVTLGGTFRGDVPLVLTGTGFEHADWTRKGFLEQYGHLPAKANNGLFNRMRSREVVTIGDYLQQNTSAMQVFLVEREARMTFGGLSTRLSSSDLFRGFDYRPILSLGVAASPTHFHKHQETWLHLLAGRKAWWFRMASSSPKFDPCKMLPEQALNASIGDGLLFCVQHPGETVYFGNLTWHATCNIDPFVLAVGAQGHTEGIPALHRAARHNDASALQTLLAATTTEPVNIEEKDYMNRTALQHAALIGHAAALSLLVAAGAKTDADNPLPLATVAEFGDHDSLQVLLDAGASLHRTTPTGGEAIHYAAKAGHQAVLSTLLARRASPSVRGPDGAEPLHWAAMEGSPGMIDFLLRLRANPNSRMADKATTPLHLSAASGHAALSHALLLGRADVQALDGAKMSAAQIARARGHEDAALSTLLDAASPHNGAKRVNRTVLTASSTDL